MIRIPKNGVYDQTNQGDIFGNLNRSQNIDLKTSPGRLKLSPRQNLITNDAGLTTFGLPIAICASAANSHQYFAACGQGPSVTATGGIYTADTLGGAFTADALANAPTHISGLYSDMVTWMTNLYVVTQNISQDISERGSSWDNSFWTSTRSGSSLGTSERPVCLGVGFNNNLYVSNVSKIMYAPPSGNAVTSGTGTIDFGDDYTITWIRSTSTRIWIGLMAKLSSGNGISMGAIAEWDGTGTAANKIHKIEAPCALTGCVKDDVLYILDAHGKLRKFTGTGFKEIARLPVTNQNVEMPGIYSGYTNLRWVHPRGMDLVDGHININVNNYVSSNVYVEDMPSGIWELNDNNPSNPFLYHKSSPCAASTDWGQSLVSQTGAILGTKRSTGGFLAGYTYYTDSGATTHNGIFFDDVVNGTDKRSIVTYPFINSANTQDEWVNLLFRNSPLTANSKILSKYRTTKDSVLPIFATGTWASGTLLQSTDAGWANAVAGNEVEIVQGVGSGSTAHIASISLVSSVYQIGLDDSIGAVPGSCIAKINNYKKLPVLSALNTSYGQVDIGVPDTRIQIKTELRSGGALELDDMTLNSTRHN